MLTLLIVLIYFAYIKHAHNLFLHNLKKFYVNYTSGQKSFPHFRVMETKICYPV